jgi:hypothetical protein
MELVGGCLRFVLKGEASEKGRLNGRTRSTIATARPTAAMWKLGTRLKTIDNFDDPHGAVNTLGGRNTPPTSGLMDELLLANENPAGAGITAFQFMHIDRVLRASFTSTPVPGTSAGPGSPAGAVASGRWKTAIPGAHQDFGGFDLLTLRVTKKWNPATIAHANDPRVKVRLTDAAGHVHEELAAGSVTALPSVRRVTPSGSGTTFDLTKFHFETWEVALSSFAGVNLHQVAAVEVEMVGLAGEPVYVDTISLVKL